MTETCTRSIQDWPSSKPVHSSCPKVAWGHCLRRCRWRRSRGSKVFTCGCVFDAVLPSPGQREGAVSRGCTNTVSHFGFESCMLKRPTKELTKYAQMSLSCFHRHTAGAILGLLLHCGVLERCCQNSRLVANQACTRTHTHTHKRCNTWIGFWCFKAWITRRLL